MAQIFISYRRSETGYVATILADALKAQFGENSVFMDVDNIPLGVDFRDHIGAAVAECQILLALIGADWLASKSSDGTRRIDASDDFVRIELEAALERGIPVIPILTDGAAMPSDKLLPSSIRKLAFRNAAELHSGRDLRSQLHLLVDHLKRLLAQIPAATQVPVQNIPRQSNPPIPPARRRPWLFLTGASLAAFIGMVAVYFFFTGTRSLPNVREVVLQTQDDAPIPLFKAADRGSEKMGALRRGSRVYLESSKGGWKRISIDPGWLAARNFNEPEFQMLRPLTTTTLLSGHPAVVTYAGVDGLNLRKSPTVQGDNIIACLLAETRVEVTGDSVVTNEYEWWPVRVSSAWISTEGISLREDKN
ncbi:MAG TPA: TIR domain-containing protein [Chthoniobacterales bacterium]